MADPLTTYALITGGGALANAFFGEDEFQMSPETRRIYDMILGKVSAGGFGMSPAELEALQSKLKTGIQEQTQTQTGSSLASLGRRGPLSPGQTAGVTTGIQAAGGKAFGAGLTEIGLGNEQLKRQEEQSLLSLLAQLSGQSQFKPGGIQGIGNIAENIALLQLLKGQTGTGTGGG